MDNPSDCPGGGRPPRKELQGPRPTPLKVRKESHKIRKPPIAPLPPGVPPQQHPPPQQPRQPVIIYTVSPKVIHANPNEFMNLVQRLTGPDATSSSSTPTPTPSREHYASGTMSPAARFASIEKTKMPPGDTRLDGGGVTGDQVERSSRVVIPGILSPGPGSLPPISPNLFSPLFNDPTYSNNNNVMNFWHGLSGVQYGGSSNRSYVEGSNNYMQVMQLPSPFSNNMGGGNFLSPGAVISPASLDLLHQILNG